MIRFTDDTKNPDQIGIAALGFLGQHEDLLNRFLDLSGLVVGQLRDEASKPAFFVALLDFILANEPDLLDFAGSIEADPRLVGVARNKLAEKAGIPGEDFPS